MEIKFHQLNQEVGELLIFDNDSTHYPVLEELIEQAEDYYQQDLSIEYDITEYYSCISVLVPTYEFYLSLCKFINNHCEY